VLDGLEEPAFANDSTANSPFDWANFPEIPPVLAVRMRAFAPSTPDARPEIGPVAQGRSRPAPAPVGGGGWWR
jgi:hypothetical protein